MGLILYEYPPTRSIRVRWALQELGVPFDAVLVDMSRGEHKAPTYLNINPAGKIPALMDDDLVLTESVAICLYLADKFPEKNLLPGDVTHRGEVYRWLFFAATELEQSLWRHACNTRIYPKDRQQRGDIENARRDFVHMAQVLEDHLAGREYIVGDSLTVADPIMAYTLDWANELGWLQDMPICVAYFERMLARPAAPPRIRGDATKLRKQS